MSLPSMGMFQTVSRCLDVSSGALSLSLSYLLGHSLMIAAALGLLYLLARRIRRRGANPELPAVSMP